MSFRNVVKDGWHPKGRDGGKESWRGDFKGINQVAGWMGKGKDGKAGESSQQHVSRPLSTLKDPSSFGPPPKNVNYHGGAALPNEITPHRDGWGAPLTQDQIHEASLAASRPAEEEVQEQVTPAGPPLPYRADRTGLRTDHLPPPPTARRDINTSPAPPNGAQQPPKPKPGLPPRLPSRQNTASSVAGLPVSSPPPAYETLPAKQPSPQPSSHFGINQAAVNRLGDAGVSVPGLGIGSQSTSTNPWQNEPSQSTIPKSPSPNPPPSTAPALNQLSELQSRFSRMNSTTQPPPPVQQSQSQAQPQGTSWAEKQAALRTASNFQKDPSSVSMSDARSAATTANSFRERHKEDISAAGQRANQFNRKYNVTGKLNSFLEKHSSPSSETTPQIPQYQQQQQTSTPVAVHEPHNSSAVAPEHIQPQPQVQQQSPELTASISRKPPPPPPPPKKPANMQRSINGTAGSAGAVTGAVSPPPVPLGTKPGYA
ncbi:uncharacterized protein A1O9_07198 [Exophiala aquamarina CBS 119918]|uniref:Uncharacterized protein n=1 Tax=Exophiala aquamarina CBS 119918 TaxID=1182545 RepID=A0A072PCH8_9EURO|nr:uncharacterized protein A1O9_07198 [Exophiala aquamarina CBS 119918]KEF57008.1 hypothetical protein A1O9_07198 [Exophiala aquamarina CBS 119918]